MDKRQQMSTLIGPSHNSKVVKVLKGGQKWLCVINNWFAFWICFTIKSSKNKNRRVNFINYLIYTLNVFI